MATLISNDHDRDLSGIVPGTVLCAYCVRELFYPYMVTDDRNKNRYHFSCAVRLAAEITEKLADYLKVKEEDGTLDIKPYELKPYEPGE